APATCPAAWATFRGSNSSRRFMGLQERTSRKGAKPQRRQEEKSQLISSPLLFSSFAPLRLCGRYSLLLLLVRLVEHGLELLGVALDGQDDGALLDSVGRGGDGRDDLPAVGQLEAHGEGAVGAEAD